MRSRRVSTNSAGPQLALRESTCPPFFLSISFLPLLPLPAEPQACGAYWPGESRTRIVSRFPFARPDPLVCVVPFSLSSLSGRSNSTKFLVTGPGHRRRFVRPPLTLRLLRGIDNSRDCRTTIPSFLSRSACSH